MKQEVKREVIDGVVELIFVTGAEFAASLVFTATVPAAKKAIGKIARVVAGEAFMLGVGKGAELFIKEELNEIHDFSDAVKKRIEEMKNKSNDKLEEAEVVA